MKIAFYNHTSTISGAEISLLLTAKHMTEASPVLFAPEGELLAKARSYGIEVCPLPSFRARMTRNPVMLAVYAAGTWWAGWKLARTIRRSGVDLIHANSIRAGIMASLFRWYHRLPVVWHIRDMPPQGDRAGRRANGRHGPGADRHFRAGHSRHIACGARRQGPSRAQWRRAPSG